MYTSRIFHILMYKSHFCKTMCTLNIIKRSCIVYILLKSMFHTKGLGFRIAIFRSTKTIRWPIAMGWRPLLSIVRRSLCINISRTTGPINPYQTMGFHYYWIWPPIYLHFAKFCIFSRKLHDIFCIVCTLMLHNLHRTWMINSVHYF